VDLVSKTDKIYHNIIRLKKKQKKTKKNKKKALWMQSLIGQHTTIALISISGEGKGNAGGSYPYL